jgi:hypothetical protein
MGEEEALNLGELVADKLIVGVRFCDIQVGGLSLLVEFYGLLF